MSKEDIQYYLSKRTLFFTGELEKQFQEDYRKGSLKTSRTALVLALLLYFAFGLLDIIIAPSTKYAIWFIRYAVVVPVLVASLIMTYSSIFKKTMQYLLGFASMTMGAGIIAMIAIARDIESGLYYYAGLMLVITWAYTYVRLRFVYATVVCWLIVIGYEISAVFFQNMLASPGLVRVFINNNFFFISANIIGMFVCYSIETSTRRDFLQRLLIEEKQDDLQNERNQLKHRNELMENDLQMARIIQQELIPKIEPFESMAFLFKPMEPVGGDFFDFIIFREHDKIGIFISDVSGHGASAALITSMIKSTVNKSGAIKDDPAKMLYYLNDSLFHQTGNNYITAFYCIYTTTTRSLKYANAGHPYPLVITDDGITHLDKNSSLPLAIMDNDYIKNSKKTYMNTEETLPRNSKLMLFTDGLMEASPDKNRKRMFAKYINEILAELKPRRSKEFIALLYERLVSFTGSEDFEDDICVICLDID